MCLARQHEMGKSEFRLHYFLLFLTVIVIRSVRGSDDDIDNNQSDSDLGYNLPGGKFPITDEDELNELVDRVKTNLKNLGDTENGPKLEFIRVKSAEYRVATGFIYTLVAEINENNENKVDCTINLWEKPWLDFVKLDVECGEEKRKYQWRSREDPDEILNTTPTTTTSTSYTPICNTIPTEDKKHRLN